MVVTSTHKPTRVNSLWCWHVVLALADLKEGRVDAARRRLGDIESCLREVEQKNGKSSGTHIVHALNLMEAEVLVAEGSFDDAVRVGQRPPAGSYWGYFFPLCLWANCPLERDVVARAYEKKGDLDKAIQEYEQLLTFVPHQDNRLLVLPVYHYRLAKLCEKKGRTAEAVGQYQKFLTIMGEADVYLAEIADAKKRVAALKRGGS